MRRPIRDIRRSLVLSAVITVAAVLSLSVSAATSLGVPTWGLREDFRIGEASGGSGTNLTMMTGAAIDSTGGLYLLQPMQGAINVYDSRGVFRTTLGRGRGPGEFIMPVRIGFQGDSLWVADVGNARVTIMHPAGRARTIQLTDLTNLGPEVSLRPAGWLEGDRILAYQNFPRSVLESGTPARLGLYAFEKKGAARRLGSFQVKHAFTRPKAMILPGAR